MPGGPALVHRTWPSQAGRSYRKPPALGPNTCEEYILNGGVALVGLIPGAVNWTRFQECFESKKKQLNICARSHKFISVSGK